MIDLTKKILPCAIEVHGKTYAIYTDFQYFVNFSKMITENHSVLDYDFLYKDKKPLDRMAGFHALADFTFQKSEFPKDSGEPCDEIILSYEKDADYIYSAFYHYYKIDLLDETLSLHWYKFLALLNGLKETKLNDIMGFRSYKPKATDGKEYKNQMNRLKELWRIEPPLTDEEQSALDKFEKLNGN